jgi:signal transduction histidine kinase
MRRSRRRDEIGVAQRELRVMQQRVRAALRQKARLAGVGAAVSKINHDLRNMLATAVIVSDRLAMSEDPAIRKASGPLLAALDRAINL